MTNIIMNKTRIVGKVRVGFDDRGLRLLSFKKFGIPEEGLALVFKPKDATPKSILRIKGLVQDFERAVEQYSSNPRRIELLDKLEILMKKLCGKIGQLEKLAAKEGNSDDTVLARRALHLIDDYCGVAVFQQRVSSQFKNVRANVSILGC